MEIAVLGYGTVGSGVARVLEENQSLLQKKTGHTIHIKYVLDLRDFPGDPLEDKVVHDIDRILNDAEVQVVAETMGGLHPAYEFVSRALKAGKSVVTSNKDMVAEYGAELTEEAARQGVDFFYEASVGGGIPIIRAMDTSLLQENIYGICGIVNGTTNYILTKMEEEGNSFEEALAEAQIKGFAELNPENDIKGKDSCRKLAILSGIAYDIHMDWKQISTTGIDKIQREDISAAQAAGYRIKLIAHSMKRNGKVYAAVEPMLLPLTHALAPVHNEYNCIMLQGNMVDDIYFQGKGAGSHATGSAVVADISAAVLHKAEGHCFRRSMERKRMEPCDFGQLPRTYLVRTDGNVSVEEWQAVKEEEGIFAYIVPKVIRAELEEQLQRVESRGHRVMNCLAMEEKTQC